MQLGSSDEELFILEGSDEGVLSEGGVHERVRKEGRCMNRFRSA